jgi:hypothetical protein
LIQGGSKVSFSNFIKALYSVISEGKNQADFTRDTLIEIIDKDSKAADVLFEKQASTYRSYFNGNRQISSLVNEINTSIDYMNFVSYLESLPEGALQNIGRALAPHNKDWDLGNLPLLTENIAKLFETILLNNDKKAPKSSQENETQDGVKDLTQLVNKQTVFNHYGSNGIQTEHIDSITFNITERD